MLQVVFTGVVYFLLYRFLLRQLGAEQMGVWSLVLTTSSLASLANLGFTSGLIKFIAEHNVKKEFQKIPSLLLTGLITMSIIISILSFIIYFISINVLDEFVPMNQLSIAFNILPYSILSLVLNTLGGNFTSTLEGLKLNYIKNIIYIIGLVLLSIMSYILTPKWGLKGVAYSQIFQSLLVFFLSAIAVTYKVSQLSNEITMKSYRVEKIHFKKLLGYGSKFQGITICQMLYEPIAKSYLSKFGGIGQVAYYEMANRLVSQIRSLITSVNQVMIPLIAEANVEKKENLQSIYKNAISIIIFVEVPLFTTLIILTPKISLIWLGNYNYDFITYGYLLCVTTFILILNGPAYFGLVGEGKLKRLLWVNLFMVLCITFLPMIISPVLTKGSYIVGLSSFIVVIGSLYMTKLYLQNLNISFSHVFNKDETQFLLKGVFISLLSIFLYYNNGFILPYEICVFFLILILLVVCAKFIVKSGKLKILLYKK